MVALELLSSSHVETRVSAIKLLSLMLVRSPTRMYDHQFNTKKQGMLAVHTTVVLNLCADSPLPTLVFCVFFGYVGSSSIKTAIFNQKQYHRLPRL